MQIEGALAVGTTSFGMAASARVPDGGRLSKAATAALAQQLCHLPVHITADIEDGYSDDPVEVAEFVARLAVEGVVGVNIEDSRDGHLINPVAAAAKIAAVKQSTPGVFVNAQVDNLWFAEEATVDAVLLRARIYANAGADGIFLPGLAVSEAIRSITAGIGLPVNVLAHQSLTVAELGELGVRRASSGCHALLGDAKATSDLQPRVTLLARQEARKDVLRAPVRTHHTCCWRAPELPLVCQRDRHHDRALDAGSQCRSLYLEQASCRGCGFVSCACPVWDRGQLR
ncbi:isocitrate lyase/phosphoenolpyruvate mutase family protein [Arthrobacter sp.]|uniref:isocitrate lyase/phosphoenolpyruvate mutase family protein n=1 Tax=Arthrobacter sp. TaxID=1667 RepID=UPI0026E07146|nr:isocitrate lyase/phosphoenolpyruvate mutase family protein [Arthrobacter sp.]MDO5753728.1 isocitrate lyase/phosphoenolpyruvate mutase family protein [Arthrobacter sp.]